MKCPYAVHRKDIVQCNTEYDEEGKQISWTQIGNNIAAFVDCKKEECGAWHDGRCHYGKDD